MRPTATKSYMNVTLKPARKSLLNDLFSYQGPGSCELFGSTRPHSTTVVLGTL